MWWGEIEGRFKAGCREGCRPFDIAHSIGIDPHDLLDAAPKWL